MGNIQRMQGLQFENILQIHARQQGIHVEKMPLGARRIGREKLIQIKTNYDFCLIHNGVCVFIDAKSYDSDRFAYSSITPHQVHALTRLMRAGVQSGYVVWHRPSNCVVFYDALKLDLLQPGQSISPLNGVYLGTFENIALGTLFV